jgi:hypothetical protein
MLYFFRSQLYNNPQAKTFVDAWFMQAVRPIGIVET